jgi:hypothetical protein
VEKFEAPALAACEEDSFKTEPEVESADTVHTQLWTSGGDIPICLLALALITLEPRHAHRLAQLRNQ